MSSSDDITRRAPDIAAETNRQAAEMTAAVRRVTSSVAAVTAASTPEELRRAADDARLGLGLALLAAARASEQVGALAELARWRDAS